MEDPAVSAGSSAEPGFLVPTGNTQLLRWYLRPAVRPAICALAHCHDRGGVHLMHGVFDGDFSAAVAFRPALRINLIKLLTDRLSRHRDALFQLRDSRRRSQIEITIRHVLCQ